MPPPPPPPPRPPSCAGAARPASGGGTNRRDASPAAAALRRDVSRVTRCRRRRYRCRSRSLHASRRQSSWSALRGGFSLSVCRLADTAQRRLPLTAFPPVSILGRGRGKRRRPGLEPHALCPRRGLARGSRPQLRDGPPGRLRACDACRGPAPKPAAGAQPRSCSRQP
ncbi:uncharacterized protein LOC126484954 [Schistocerca serialis cubense]|uniref:uncharacterized protein LOC126484954 n=1 Tax=Schistocerca serialis cubense TaxID=2023355 RepID=UPI00214F3D20|nr:uncharacterized protein LOC126484954 [Schistocerca serialis cubense]